MITTLTGPNSYMLQKALHDLTNAFVAKHTDMGLERFDGQELDPQRLPSVLQSLPFLADKRLVVLRAPSTQKALAEQLEKLLDDIPDSTDVIIIEPRLDKRTSYYKALQKKTSLKTFDDLDERALATWLTAQAKELDATLSTTDANYLVHRVGLNQSMLHNELQKLAHYNPAITRTTIDELTEPLPQGSVFDLLDAAFAGQTAKALNLYEAQRKQKVEPQAILAMIAWQLHVLAVVKTAGQRAPGDIASQAKLNPYVVRKTQSIANKLTLAQIKSLISATYHLDLRLKSQPIDADDALQHLITTIGM
jgi:DNA polymerase-3 subunit delta